MNGRGNVTYFLFDSHSRNSHGITDGGPGFSVLIKFESLFQIERYIEEAYQVSGRVYPPYFQIQFISVNGNVDDLAIIQSSQIICFRRMKRQQKQAKENLQETQDRKHKKKSQMTKMRAKFKSSPRHEEVKRADRIHKKSRARTLNFDANNEVPRFCSNVSVFKQLIKSAPYYICVVCNCCLNRRSVGLFNRNSFVRFLMMYLALFRHLMVTFTYARLVERN